MSRRAVSLLRDDWRRSNVDIFVRDLYRSIKATKPWVKFGVSPFGVWRPGNPAQIKGFDAYAEFYADSKRWLNEGWLDYFTPQLYWPIARQDQSYPVLLRWWVSENTKGRNIWPGNYTSRVGSTGDKSWKAQEIINQIAAQDSREGAGGNVHFSAKVLMENRDSIGDRLLAGPYAGPALVPSSPWLDSIAPRAPQAILERDAATRATRVRFRSSSNENRSGCGSCDIATAPSGPRLILPGAQTSHLFEGGAKSSPPDQVAISAVDRVGNESPYTLAKLGSFPAAPATTQKRVVPPPKPKKK